MEEPEVYPVLVQVSRDQLTYTIHLPEEMMRCPAIYLPRHRELTDEQEAALTPTLRRLLELIRPLLGVAQVNGEPYSLVITRAPLFSHRTVLWGILDHLRRVLNRSNLQIALKDADGNSEPAGGQEIAQLEALMGFPSETTD